MKKLISLFIFGLFLVVNVSCTRYFLVDSEGWISYDRLAGKLDAMWKTANNGVVTVHDTVYVDSVNVK